MKILIRTYHLQTDSLKKIFLLLLVAQGFFKIIKGALYQVKVKEHMNTICSVTLVLPYSNFSLVILVSSSKCRRLILK